MLFTSIEFLFLFLPICLGVYYILPSKWGMKNYWLLLMSLGFYAWGEPKFVLVMVLSIVFNYVMALLIDRMSRKGIGAKVLLGLSVSGNLAVIGVWKYANFITANLRAWFPAWQGIVQQTSFLLPIGISFFTFQALSYVVDVYRGDVKVQKNPFYLALYIALFPQLIAGPIVRYSTVCDQIVSRKVTLDLFSSGVMRFLYGFNKKMLLANFFAVTADSIFSMNGVGFAMAWLGAICYSFQILFDFSGYSDMAIGLGRMFGFRFLENFDFPYVSKTVTEFWRRWHMSLGAWFRDYVYFPLGGSRVSKKRMLLNLAVVWFLTGVWHGANWTFIAWGSLYGVLIMIEKSCGLVGKVDSKGWLRALYQPLTMLMVVLGWVLFRSADISQAVHFIGAMFSFGADPSFPRFVFELREVAVLLIVAFLLSTPVFSKLRALAETSRWGLAYCLGEGGLQLTFFLVGISCLVMKTHNPFIYFNF